MNPKRFLVFFVLGVLLIFGLAACERSLAPSGVTTPQAEGQTGATPSEGTDDVMQEIWRLATQTAMAQEGQTGPQETTPVPQQTEAATTEAPSQETPSATEAATTEAPTAVPTEAPTAKAVVVPTATPGIPKTYVLQGGEFPFCIARRFNVNQYELLQLSGLSLSSRPGSGYRLTIPQTGHPFSGNRTLRSHPTTYTVRSGDNLNSIACLFGDVSPDAIATANDLKSPYDLTSGEKLQIP